MDAVLKQCRVLDKRLLRSCIPVTVTQTGQLNIALVEESTPNLALYKILFKGWIKGCTFLDQLKTIPRDAYLYCIENYSLEQLSLEKVCVLLQNMPRPMTLYFQLTEGQKLNTKGISSNQYIDLTEDGKLAEELNVKRKLGLEDAPNPKKIKVDHKVQSKRNASSHSIDYSIPLSANTNTSEVKIDYDNNGSNVGGVLIAESKRQEKILKNLEVTTGLRHERVKVKISESENMKKQAKILGAKEGCKLSRTGYRMHPRSVGKQLIGCFVDKKYRGYGWWTGIVIEYHEANVKNKKDSYVVLFKDGSVDTFSRKNLHNLLVYQDEIKRYNEWHQYPGYEYTGLEHTVGITKTKEPEVAESHLKTVSKSNVMGNNNAISSLNDDSLNTVSNTVQHTTPTDHSSTSTTSIVTNKKTNQNKDISPANNSISSGVNNIQTETSAARTVTENTANNNNNNNNKADIERDSLACIEWLQHPKVYFSRPPESLKRYIEDKLHCEIIPVDDYAPSFRHITFMERIKKLALADIYISNISDRKNAYFLMELGVAVSNNIPIIFNGKLHLELYQELNDLLQGDWNEEDLFIEIARRENTSYSSSPNTASNKSMKYKIPRKMVAAVNDFMCNHSTQIKIYLPALGKWGITFGVVDSILVIKDTDEHTSSKNIDIKRGDIIYSIEKEVVLNTGWRGGQIYDYLAQLKGEKRALTESRPDQYIECIECVVLRQCLCL